MALEIIRAEQAAEQAASGAIVTDRRLYLAADRTTVVEDGDPRSAFLLVAKGQQIPGNEVKRLGLTVEDGVVVVAAEKQAAKKEAKPAEDKQRTPGENKGGK